MANESKKDIIITINAFGIRGLGVSRAEQKNQEVVQVKKKIIRKKVEGKTIHAHTIDCNICGEDGIMVKITCPYCNFGCCKNCFDTYILTTQGDTKCMSCKVNFDLNTVWKLCNKTVYKKYLDFRLDQLIQKEKSLFQESLIEIENEKMARKYSEMKYKFDKIQEILVGFQIRAVEMNNLDSEITDTMLSSIGFSFKQLKRMRVRENMAHVSKKIEELSAGVSSDELKKNTFIKNCSVTDCKGTLNNKWYCRLCEAPHCNKCGELKNTTDRNIGDGETKAGGEHICDPNSVQTLNEIKKNSKPCPKCGVSIFKTEGCDQMFCIVCHTAFSWNTLQIETGRIHNPHYYEILRKNGEIHREEGDIRPCDELMFYLDRRHEVYNAILLSNFERSDRAKYYDAPRFVNELDAREWNERTYVLNGRTFSDIRKAFIKNQIQDVEYRRKMKLKFNKFTKMQEVAQVLSVTKLAMSEELKRLIRNENGEYIRELTHVELVCKITGFMANMESIIANTNKILMEIGRKYTSYYNILYDDRYRIVTSTL